jgi:hypothetical protein
MTFEEYFAAGRMLKYQNGAMDRIETAPELPRFTAGVKDGAKPPYRAGEEPQDIKPPLARPLAAPVSGGYMDEYRGLVPDRTLANMNLLLDNTPEGAGRQALRRDFESAIYINQIYPAIGVADAVKHSEMIRKAMYPDMKSPEGFVKHLADAWKIGALNEKRNAAAVRLLNGGDYEGDADDWKRIEELDGEIAKLADGVPANWFIGALGITAASVREFAYPIAKSAAAGLAAGVVAGGIAGLPSGPGALATAGGGGVAGMLTGGAGGAAAVIRGAQALTALTTQAAINRQIYAGQAYVTMKAAGIDDDIAKPGAWMTGGLQSAVETALGVVPIGGAAQKLLANGVFKNFMKQGAYKTIGASAFRGAAGRTVRETAMNLAELPLEGVEEGGQAFAGNVMLQLAALKSDRIYGGVDWQKVEEGREDIFEAAKAGLITGAVMGLPAGFARAVTTPAKAYALAEEARSIARNADGPEQAYNLLKKSEVGEYLDDDTLKLFAARNAEEAFRFMPEAPAPVEGSPAPFRLGNNGKLRGRFGKNKFKFTDGIVGSLEYGTAYFDVTGEEGGGGKVTVTGIDVTNKNITNPDDLKARVLTDIAEAYPDYQIDWTVKDGGEQRVKDAALRRIESRREKSYAEAPAKAEGEVYGVLQDLLGLRGRVDVVKDAGEIGQVHPADQEKLEGLRDVIKGATVRRADNGRLVIYINDRLADATTLAHELIHAYTREASPELRERLSKAMGLADGSESAWEELSFKSRDGKDINAHEKLAEYWEDYLSRKNSLIPAEVKALFDRLAEAVKKIFDALGWKGEDIPADLRALFDDMVSGNAAVPAAENARTAGISKKESGGLEAFNKWAANPAPALPAGLHYVKGALGIRREQPVDFADGETAWITTDDKSLLFPNPRLFNELTDISEFYKTDAKRLRERGQNAVKITKAAEITPKGFIEYPGELEIERPGAFVSEDTALFSLDESAARKTDNVGMDAAQWLVEAAKDIGIDINGFHHVITDDSVTHAIDGHSNEEREKNNGQIVLKPEDIKRINDIVTSPDYTFIGAKKGALNIIAYAKTFEDGTIIYFENIINSKNNPKSLVSKTMYKRKNPVTPDKFKNIVAGNRTDISKGKIVAGSGGHPSNKTENSPPATNSGMPHSLNSISSDSAEKSIGGFNGPDSGELLFQLTREAEAGRAGEAVAAGKSREKFIDEGLLDYYTDAPPEGVKSAAEMEKWLGDIYDAAKAARSKAKGKEGRLTTTEINARLTADFREDTGKNGKFLNFMMKAGEILRGAKDTALLAELLAIGKPGVKSGGYKLFENAAKRVYDGGVLAPRTRASLITFMKNDMERFRDLYVRVTGDEEYRALSTTEIVEDFESGVRDKGRLSAYELGRAKARIRDKGLRRKIEAETASDSDYKAVIERADKEIRALKEEIKERGKLEKERGAALNEAARAGAELEAADKDYTAALRAAERGAAALRRGIEKREAAAAERTAKAAEGKKTALEKLKAALKAAYAERRAAARLLADKRRILKAALKPPAGDVDAKTALKITARQKEIKERYKEGKSPKEVRVEGYDKPVPIDELRKKVAEGEIKPENLSKYARKQAEKRGINELTLAEAKEFLREITLMKGEGRAVTREKVARRGALARYRVSRVLDEINRRYKDPKAKGAAKRLRDYFEAASNEERDKILRRSDLGRSFQEWIYIDRLLEGTGLGDLKDLIAKGRDEANYQEGQNINRRYGGLDRLLGKSAKEKSERIAELGAETIPVKGVYWNNGDRLFSKAFLMTASIGLEDPEMRRYLLYGVLTSAGERGAMGEAARAAKGDKEAAEAVKAAREAFGKRKEDILRAAVKEHLTAEDLALRDYIREDLTENFPRINEAVYETGNRLMSRVESYLPIFRLDRNTEEEFSVNGASYSYSKPENGFTIDRQNIADYEAMPIETDIFKLFYRGVADQEHFAAYAPFIKELAGVLGGGGARSRELREKLRVMYGRGLMNVIDDYIAVLANPRTADTGSDFGMNLVGKSTLGYITWNFLSGIKQLPQSFAPFLLKVKPQYLGASAVKYLRNIGMFNGGDYNALVKEVLEKSSDLSRRTRNIELEYSEKLKERAKNPVEKGLGFVINDLGMWMQRAADEFACVSGWDAAYTQAKAEMMKEGRPDAAQIEKEARKRADGVLAETQPTTNVMYQSMGFRKAPKAVKFFSTPLEKMFQMATGMPEMWRRREFGNIARYCAGTAVVSLAIAAMMRKFKDDDEPEERLRKAVYYGLGEPLAAHLPLAMLSNSAGWMFERLITGDKSMTPQRDFFPLLGTAEDLLVHGASGKPGKLLTDAVVVGGYLFALPSGQVRRIWKAVENGDPYGAVFGAE